MGIQINGQTDTISASDGGLAVSGYELTGPSNISVTGIVTTSQLNVGTGGTVITTTASGLVGIGTDNPDEPLHISASDPAIKMEDSDGTDQYSIIKNANGNSIYDAVNGSGTAGAHIFRAPSGSSNEHVRILPTGGITFNGDTAAANALDDYEEGTWTPRIYFGGSDTGAVYSSQTGNYVKVGRMVTVFCLLTTSTKSSSTGTATLGGLPFTPSSNGLDGYSALASADVANITFTNPFSIRVVGNNTNATFIHSNGSALTDTAFANNSQLIASGSYIV